MIVFCVVVGFLNCISAAHCCGAMALVRFVGYEVDFSEEPVVVGDGLKSLLSVLEADAQ